MRKIYLMVKLFCFIIGAIGSFSGNVTAASFFSSSDINKKTNIKKISDSIYSFNWKNTEEKSYGFIAQYLKQTNPELVDGEDGNMTVNYNAALALTIAKLENRVKELEDYIKNNMS